MYSEQNAHDLKIIQIIGGTLTMRAIKQIVHFWGHPVSVTLHYVTLQYSWSVTIGFMLLCMLSIQLLLFWLFKQSACHECSFSSVEADVIQAC